MNADSPSRPYADFALWMTSARDEAGLKQNELASILGCTQQSISRWEAGTHRPAAEQIPALAKALDADEDDVLLLAGYGPALLAQALPLIPIDALEPYIFEQFTGDLLHARYPEAQVRQQGATGHKQDGTDVLLDWPDGRVWSFQCKRYDRFGPAEVRKVVAAHEVKAERAFLVLSRVASPQAAAALKGFPGWTLWDKQDVAREFRALAPEDQDRLVDLYFPGQRMLLLGRDEAGPWLDLDQFFAPFRGKTSLFSHDWALSGREGDLEALVAVLEADTEQRAVLLVGQGGMGKSRLLKAGVERFAQRNPGIKVRLLSSAIDPDRKHLEQLGRAKKLLVVDDAHDRDGLGVLFEYAADPRNKTRLLLATRPYAEPRLIDELALLGQVKPPTIRLERLDKAALRALITQVLESFAGDASWADGVLEASCENPLVAAMAARVVARENLPMELARHADDIRTIVLARFADVVAGKLAADGDAPLMRSVLDVIAAVQPIHIEDQRFLQLYAKVRPGADEADVLRILKLLIEGGILYKRGALYRLMPDLLGDFLIEKSCIGLDRRLTAFALALAEAVEGRHLTQLLVNLGRLDWRLVGGDPSKSDLLRPIWRALEDIDTPYDPRIEAIKAVAIFQPGQALEFVQAMLDADRIPDVLAGILRRIAHSPAHRTDALHLLWELGRDDKRDTSPHPDHPIRVLTDLIGYDAYRPLSFTEEAAAFAFALFEDPLAWGHLRTPFDLLELLLSGQGMTTHATARAFSFEPFFIDYDVVAPLRAKVIAMALGSLESKQPRIAHRAAIFLNVALRRPHGAFNMAATDELLHAYDAEFARTIAAIGDKVKAGQLAPATLIGLARTLSWHAQYDEGALHETVLDIFDAYPTDLIFRLTAALTNGSDYSFLGQLAFAEWGEDTRWMPVLVAELREAVPDPAARYDLIVARLRLLDAAGEATDYNGLLFDEMVSTDIGFARELIARITADPDSRIGFALGFAVGTIFAADPVEGEGLYLDMVGSDVAALRRFAARALFGFKGVHAEAEQRLLRHSLQADDAAVAGMAATAARIDRERDVRTAIDLAMLIPFERHLHLFHDFGMLMGSAQQRLLKALQPRDVRALLARMVALPKLEGHWTDELLRYFARHHAAELATFLLQRTAEGFVADRGIEFLGMRYGNRESMHFEESPEAPHILRQVWAWLRDHDEAEGYTVYAAGELVNAMFRVDSDPVVAFLDAMLDRAAPADLRWMARILRHVHWRFVFNYSGFVERFLDRCKAAGRDVVKLAIDQLGAASMTGMRTGRPGEPMPRDLEARDLATDILGRLSRLSPAYRLYKDILADAERDIAQAIEQGRLMDEADA